MGLNITAIIASGALLVGLYVGTEVSDYRHQQAVIKVQAQNEQKLKELEKRKDDTITLLLESKAHDSVLDERIKRLQFNLSSTDRQLLKDASRATTESVRTCRQLLSESAGLHSEGLEILRDLNTRLEAFIKLNSKGD